MSGIVTWKLKEEISTAMWHILWRLDLVILTKQRVYICCRFVLTIEWEYNVSSSYQRSRLEAEFEQSDQELKKRKICALCRNKEHHMIKSRCQNDVLCMARTFTRSLLHLLKPLECNYIKNYILWCFYLITFNYIEGKYFVIIFCELIFCDFGWPTYRSSVA